MIVVENLHVYYDNIHAIKGVSFEVHKSEITALIGANGAGKSTIIKSICGLLNPREGKILLNGSPIQRMSANQVVRLGVGLVPEGRRVFPVLTVDENLNVGAYGRSDKQGIARDKEKMYETFPVLKDRWKQYAGSLSGGEQQMLAIARALMSKPQLLLMDEPSLGLAPLLVKQVFEIITDLNKEWINDFFERAKRAQRVENCPSWNSDGNRQGSICRYGNSLAGKSCSSAGISWYKLIQNIYRRNDGSDKSSISIQRWRGNLAGIGYARASPQSVPNG